MTVIRLGKNSNSLLQTAERLSIINPTSGETIDNLEQVFIYPAKHFVLPEERVAYAVDEIKQELGRRLVPLPFVGSAVCATVCWPVWRRSTAPTSIRPSPA